MLVLTRDPVADRIGSVVVAALTRTRRELVSELLLTKVEDGVPSDCVVNFDNLHTLPRATFRRRIAQLSPRAWPRPARHSKLRRAVADSFSNESPVRATFLSLGRSSSSSTYWISSAVTWAM